MSGEHDRRHAELFERWLGGGRLAPQEQRELSTCPHCGGEAAALERLVEELDAAGSTEREARIAAALALEDDPSFDAAARALRSVMEGRARRRRGGLALLVLAATAAATAVLYLRGQRGDESDRVSFEPPILLGAPLVALEPRGEVQDFVRFSWTSEVPGASSQRILVWDARDAAALPTVHGPIDAAAREWVPDDDARSTLPARIRWLVSARDESGEETGRSVPVEAWRSPP